MAAPQKENGYTPIANEILEAVYAAKLSATQYKILMILWRYTYGYNRKNAPISQSFIAKATDTHISSVRREMAKLVKWGIVREISPAGFNRAKVLEFNKNYDEWKPTQVAPTLGGSADANSTQNEADTGSAHATQKRNIKQDTQQQARAYARFYTANFGVLTPFISQEAESFLDDGMTDELIVMALEKAVGNNKRYWSYAKGILNRWLEAGIDTPEKARAERVEFKNRTRGKPKDTMERSYTAEEKKKREQDAYADMERLYGE